MIAFYKHLISTSTEMLVISKAAASRDRKKPKPQQNNTKKPPKPKPKTTTAHTQNNKILPKINLKTSFHEVLVMMFNGSMLWSSAG